MPSSGWPFLVASGRRRDHSILLAPDFLVDALDYGVLEEVAGPGSERARVVETVTGGGQRLWIGYATHLVTAGDVAGGAARDEHGRPLRLVYGFVTRDRLSDIAPDDMAYAREVALGTYRRFLDDEEQYAVTAAPAFDLRSATVAGSPATAARTRAASAAVAGTPAGSAAWSSHLTSTVAWLSLLVIATALALTVLLWPRPAEPPRCPAVQSAPPSAAPASPSPSCVPTPGGGA
ncbi:MAG: hypothetical protein ACRDT6_09375 [Micromonosporaceae bacterium]